jgi:hypothetical protein
MAAGVSIFAAPDSHRLVRLLSWTYRRDDEVVECHLSLTLDNSAYELRIRPQWNPVGKPVELFDDAVAAFDRQTMIERLLVSDGWSLERFESTRIAR